MNIAQGDIWIADLGQPFGSEAGFVRPIVIVQSDSLNRSRLESYVAIPLTSAVGRGSASWNLVLRAGSTGLDRDSVAQTNLIVTVAKNRLIEQVGRLNGHTLRHMLACLDIALGRT